MRQGVLGKVKALATLLRSSWRGRRLVRQLGAGIVVGTGGYVSAPAVLGAIHHATGVRIHELPATPDRVRRALLEAGVA